ncbi:MAG: DeoR/GlpR family DNA-binding transcription regulator [Ancrocorticia sp.]|jgi:DeoR/GlpR family transcriptional regulator of sugar metabolism|nr:DeoR/GlpR family DNA-binding transcription regulator [Ancrocorticia sp.]MCI1964428.1 DeoR/GlpR family DNA-binding transcription regulator [Ancrocorticia sp.]MCI2002239.1 DeoR/GlpR family DNA-binding transcription regulator [Ancrocorticia sp.]MCI2179243.1 DeoR/GlpR family DNA-binding transcription regulator [Ancrocorticia sp.]MCI2194379.1 DeoR/GlpR family DNA-binding transcription regulator [Ancrocorticia sp.]
MGKLGAESREQRLQSIIGAVAQAGSVTIEELASQLDVSVMTVYRDVASLNASGLVHRSRGRVTAAPFSMAEASALVRMTSEPTAKEKLAQAALELIEPNSSVAIDDSTTCLHLFPGMKRLAPMTVVTYARFIAERVVEFSELELIQLGGNYIRWADAFAGVDTLRQIEGLTPDYCVMSTSAIVDGMCCHPDVTVASLKGALMRSARTKILMVDHTKFQRRALHRFLPLSEVDVVITEASVGDETLEMLRALVPVVKVV